MATNKKVGNSFETEFCEYLSHFGFWVHNMAQNASGQPADVIAVRSGDAFLIDCKVCSHDVFNLSRIEENQTLAMETWEECGNDVGWFALKFREKTYMISLPALQQFSYRKSVVRPADAECIGFELERWVEEVKW